METVKKIQVIWCSVLLSFSLAACSSTDNGFAENRDGDGSPSSSAAVQEADTIEDVPEYSGEPYVEINDNQPEFEEYELTTVAYETVNWMSSADAARRRPAWARRPCRRKTGKASAR